MTSAAHVEAVVLLRLLHEPCGEPNAMLCCCKLKVQGQLHVRSTQEATVSSFSGEAKVCRQHRTMYAC